MTLSLPPLGTIEDFRRSTVARITLVYLVILLATISSLGLYVYWRVSEQMWQQLERHIETEVEGLAEQYQSRGLRGMLKLIDERLARIPDRRSIYLVEDQYGQWLIGNISKWPEAAVDENGWLSFELYDKSTSAMTSARVHVFRLNSGARLLVGRDTGEIIRTKLLIRNALMWGTGFALLLGCGCAILFSRRAWAKLRIISNVTQQVVKGDLDVRVPHDGSKNDLEELSQNINLMLEEINHLMVGIKRVSDNIAHDLKTPLARVRNRFADFENQSDVELRGTVNSCVHEVDELIATFNSILRIARLEYKDPGDFGSTLDVDSIVENCIELYRPIAEDKQQQLTFSGCAAPVVGDEQLITQAICNLLDNAIKFAEPATTVSIQLEDDQRGAIVTISDEGPGIEDKEKAHVFERFYRGQKGRDKTGNGLGLSLVKAIVDAHGATLELSDNHPGLRVTLRFPKTPAQPLL